MVKAGMLALLAAVASGCGGKGDSAAPRAAKEPPRACEKTDLADCETQCEAGSGASCVTLGFALGAGEGVEQDRPRGVRLYEKACELGDAGGCHAAYSVFLYGVKGVPPDDRKSAAYLAKACELGHQKSCQVREMLKKFGAR